MPAFKKGEDLYCATCRPYRAPSVKVEPDEIKHCATCGILVSDSFTDKGKEKLRFHLDGLSGSDYDDLARVMFDAGRRFGFRVHNCRMCTRTYTIRCLCRRRKDLPPWDVPDTEPADVG
jgi:hypothetical protein